MTEKKDKQQLVDPNRTKLSADQFFKKFLTEHNLILRFDRMKVKHIDNGGIIIEPPDLVVSYGRTNKS